MKTAKRARRVLVGVVALGALVAVTTASGAAGGRPVQEIVVGPGLTGGGDPNPTTGSISLGIDSSVVQSRVTGACPAGESISAIAEDGTVTCSPDADTTYSAGLGLLLTGFVFSVDTATIQARIAGSCGAGEAIRLVNADGTVACASLAGDFIRNGTAPQDASFNVTGSGVIGFGLSPFANKLRLAGGNWNPNDSETDLLIGDSVYRLKVGVATGGGGAGDVRLRAQGGTNRMMIGGGMSDTLTVTPDRVGIGTITPQRPLDARGSAYIGLGAGDFENKLWIKGGSWNPNDSDTDVLIGDAVHRLKVGVATGGGGAGDVRLRAQGGTNRMMIGGGMSDTLTVTPDRVGIGTITPGRALDVTGTAQIGSAAPAFSNKLSIKGGNWNPNDSDTDVLIGDALHRLKIGVATGGGGAGDVRLRAQGGTDRIMIGGGSADTLTVTPTRVGIGTIEPQSTLDVRGHAQLTGDLLKRYGGALERPLPLAFGSVLGIGGLAVGHTENVASAVWDAAGEKYVITIDGVSYNPFLHPTTVTPIAGNVPRIAQVLAFGGTLHVQIFDHTGSPVQSSFAFVVHQG